ncbi:hypothetical protein ACS0TY_007738 [Phlomoides rotata]
MDRKLRYNEGNDDEDHREVKPRRNRDYGNEIDKTVHKETYRVRQCHSYEDSKSDKRRRNEHGREDDDSKRCRRSEHAREDDDEEEGEYRVEEGRYYNYDNREDGRKDRQRDKGQERGKRLEESGDKHGRRSEKDRNGSETVNVKGDVKENVGIDAVANLGRSGGVYIPPFKLARIIEVGQ